ncbi:MAG: Asp-tRNA(Asn)/Glu-tRNA(Gln) amidotransferase subunit GatA [Candidatus Paceibacterota bacterium]|jgi:aspartyl-tRNA(Asn)/glutamyl-tRNA(Gln) amidotransferase subunit A
MSVDLNKLTIEEALKGLSNGDFSSEDLVKNALSAILEREEDVHAYLEVFSDAIEQAKVADQKRKNGDKGMLLGVPIAIKDNILIEGRHVTAASKILEGYVAPYDATVIKKLKDEGAVFIGRTNMDEFAMGGSTENSAFGVTKNPHDLSRVAGGSSGGSAAAVAMGSVLGALGSDTGGSIRQPASLCGVVGLKTTYGSVSRHGLMAMGSSLDQIGPFAKTVADAEILFRAISGHDKMDSTSLPDDTYDFKEKKDNPFVVGVPRDFVSAPGIDKEVLANFERSLELLKKDGVEIRDVDLPSLKHSLAVYYILMPAEASTNLARFDGVRFGLSEDGGDVLGSYMKTRGDGFGREVRRRIMLGAYVLSSGYYDAYYNKANAVRALINEDFEKAFASVDAIVTPTSPVPAFKIGEKSEDPLAMYLADIFTVPVNLAGIPAISIPSGFTEQKLPLGIQFIARRGGEETLFGLGKKFELIRENHA